MKLYPDTQDIEKEPEAHISSKEKATISRGGFISEIAAMARRGVLGASAITALAAATPRTAHAEEFRQPTATTPTHEQRGHTGSKGLFGVDIGLDGEKLFGHAGAEWRVPFTAPINPQHVDRGATHIHAGINGRVSENLAVGGLARVHVEPSGTVYAGVGPELFWRIYDNHATTPGARSNLVLYLGGTLSTGPGRPLYLGTGDVTLQARFGQWRLGAQVIGERDFAEEQERGLGILLGYKINGTFDLTGRVQVRNQGGVPLGQIDDVVFGLGVSADVELVGHDKK